MAWYNIPGNEQDTVIFTRYRVARNISEFPFPSRLDPTGAKEIIGRVGSVLEANGFSKTDFSEISHATAYSLAEKLYISPDFIRESLPHALYLNEPCNLSAMLCREEHIRLQCILPGFSVRDASASVSKIEGILDEKFNFAFEERFGYLTSDPSLLGCATEISVMLFLPSVLHSGMMPSLIERMSGCGFRMRRFFTDDLSRERNADIPFYLLSNKITGVSEEELDQRFGSAVRRIIDSERQARRDIGAETFEKITDRAMRAEGILRYAHLLSYSDYIRYSAALRLGIALGSITDVRTETLTSLLFETLPATLSMSLDTLPQSSRSVDKYRANYVKERLQA